MTNTFKKSLLIVMACLMATTIWAVDLVVSNTSDASETFTDGSVLYSIDSDGRANSSTKFGSGKDIITNGQKAKGAALVDKRFVVKFPVAVSSITIYGYNSSSGRTLSKISTSTTMEKNSYTDVTSSSNKNVSTSTPNYSYTFTANWTTAIAAGTYIWFEFSNTCNFYQISYNNTSGGGGGGTQPTTPTVSSVVIAPTSATLEPNDKKQLSVTVTASPDNADNKKVTWASDKTSVATVSESGLVTAVAQGTATITATSTIDNTKKGTCTITVNAPAQQIPATGVFLNKTSTTIGVGATETLTVSFIPADANTGKEVTWSSDNATVSVDNNGTIKGITAGGSADVTVTLNSDQTKKATCAVTVKEADPLPQTGLSVHEPDIYEEKSTAGGYGGTLTISNGREYEVYYFCKINNAIAVGTEPTSGNIATTTDKKAFEVKGNWMKGQFKEEAEGGTSSPKEDAPGSAEFKACYGDVKMGENTSEVNLHIRGFDEFTIYASDNNTTLNNNKKRWIDVYIDNMTTPVTKDIAQKPASVRRYSISPGEHVIKLVSEYSGSKIYALSLRVSDQPRVRWLKGNDSTQTVLQTQAPKSVYYFTKYSAKGETILEWVDAEATGITLEKAASSTIGDTLVLGGVAKCPVGEYKYNVVTYMNGAETSRVSGKLNVTSDIKASSDTLVDAYQGEEMEVIEFRYYALSANDVQLTWTNGTPTGITGDGVPNTNKFAISGTTSAKPGKYTYSITVKGSSTVITGYIEVISQNLGENPVLYLYQTKSPKRGYDNDGVFSYLRGKNVNLQPRTTINKLRSKEQYGKFKWILISDDVNADNAEVLEIARGGADLPVLNMKGFTYTEDRLGWGEPDNGSIDTLSHNGQYIYVQQAKHPIFNDFNAQTNSKIKIFDGLAQNGVMPINIDYPGSFALATAYTRNIEDYYKDGEMQTIIHEIPAGERNNKKYICFPLSISSSNKLSSEGKKLLTNIVDYLISSEAASMTAPKLEMTAFKIGEYNGTIDQTNNTVDLVIDTDKYPDLDLKALKPIVSVADPMTHVSPASGAEVDFQYSLYMPVDYVVTDFINRRVYEVIVRAAASQGIEEVYSLGDWVNIYDVFGRKVATTNENIFTMELPKGMYIIVTENGNTLKIMR